MTRLVGLKNFSKIIFIHWWIFKLCGAATYWTKHSDWCVFNMEFRMKFFFWKIFDRIYLIIWLEQWMQLKRFSKSIRRSIDEWIEERHSKCVSYGHFALQNMLYIFPFSKPITLYPLRHKIVSQYVRFRTKWINLSLKYDWFTLEALQNHSVNRLASSSSLAGISVNRFV